MAILGRHIGSNTKVELSSNDRKQGTYIIGVNGTGKTVLLLNIALSDIESGDGLCFLDPHGDAIEILLTLIPESRKNDVILFDPSDIEHPLGLNFFECPNISDPRLVDLVCSEVVGTFKKLYQEFWGPRLEDILRHAALTVLYNPGSTMLDLYLILIDEAYRRRLLKNVSDPIIHQYWRLIFPESRREMREWLSSAYNKIGRFMANSLIRNIVCQPKSSINLRKIMDKGNILLVNLAKGKIGEDNSSLLGSVLVGKILIAALSRAETEFKKRRQFHLIVDEFQSFITQSFSTLQSEARKFAIDTTIAHQYRDQMDYLNKGSTLNVGNFVFFRITGIDSHELAIQFDNTPPEPESIPFAIMHRTSRKGVYRTGEVSEYVMGKGKPRLYSDVANEMANRLTNLSNFECWCKLIKNGKLEEYHIKTEPLSRHPNEAVSAYIKQSSIKLSKGRKEAEKEIQHKINRLTEVEPPVIFEDDN